MASKIIQFPNIKQPSENSSGRIHTCNVCGIEGIWNSDWSWKYIIHKGSCNGGDPGWEEIYKTCSKKCTRRSYGT